MCGLVGSAVVRRGPRRYDGFAEAPPLPEEEPVVFVTHRAPARPLTVSLIVALAIAILPASAARQARAASTELFFSEYIEGSSNNKALEIFNDTGASVNLATGAYTIQMFFNGSATAGLTIDLTGTVAAGDVYVVAQASASAVILAQADQTNGAGWFNGDDAVVLRKGTTVVDVIGQVGFDPGTEWGTGLTSTMDNTLRRKAAVTAGDIDGTNAFDPAVEWDGFAVDTFRALGAHPGQPPEPGPVVTGSTPSNGATDVARNTPISIDFNESVTIDTGSIALSCGGPVPISHPAGPATSIAITFIGQLPAATACSLTIAADGVHDVDTDDPFDTMASDVAIGFTTVGTGNPCDDPFTSIPSIQGSGSSAAITGSVTTEGVVVGDYEGPSQSPQVHLRGYYIQDADGDGSAATSDGIFVFNGPNATAVNLGDSVRVTGAAADFQDQTQITQSSVLVCGTDATVGVTDISFPVDPGASLEPYEGMLVRVQQTMTVTEHFQLGRFGQVLLSSGGRLDIPTAKVAPGDPANDLQAANNRRKILVDDASQAQNPDPIVFARGGQPLSASNTLRGGDTATGIVGVMTYTFGGQAASPNAFRIRPINALGGHIEFVAVNDRPGPTVEVAGGIRVVGMNLLNYFNTFDGLPDTVDNCRNGVGGSPTDCRGADSQAEFDRQYPKTVAAIIGLDADVIGVNEIENDGYGSDSSLAHLVDQLNLAAGAGRYAYIDVDGGTGEVNAAGTDAIKVGLLYKPAVVEPVGTTAALNSVAFVNGGDGAPRSRPSIAQAWEVKATGARFIVDVNHFKSKGSACDDADALDGQGNCNVVRTNAAHALVDWLAGDPTGTGDADILIVGDLNSYALEDPVGVLTGAGYTNLVAAEVGDPYSFVFDGQWGYLDYALGSATVTDQVAGVVEWHINSDEPTVLDYNTDFKTPNLQASLYAPDRFRVSDHDPILVGLDATTDRPSVDAGGPYLVEEGASVQLSATGTDPTQDDLTYAWDLDGLPGFEAPGPSVTFAAGTLQAPQRVTVTVRVTDEHGQWSEDTATIDVIWDFGGFLSPSMPGGVTSIKAGASHPVRFSLDGDQGKAVLGGDLLLQRHACPTGNAIGSPIVAAPNEPFSYDPLTDSYKFVWKTQKAWVGWCGTLSVPLADGQTYRLEVAFKA
jgi:predicted extracellular nuclease